MKPSRKLVVWLSLGLLLTNQMAWAQGSSDKLGKAKEFFQIGAEAYGQGRYSDSIVAFKEAYKLVPKAGLAFSLAQAYRRQYTKGKKIEDLQSAIQFYHVYLKEAPKGGRRGEAELELSELELISMRLNADKNTNNGNQTADTAVTKLMIYSSTSEAKVSLNGQPAKNLPLVVETKPGNHQVVVSAPGFISEQRTVQAVPGVSTPYLINLKEKPATLKIYVDSGSEIFMDGASLGTTPLAAWPQIPAGKHTIAVVKNGSESFSQEAEFKRGEATEIFVKLKGTTQRTVSYLFLIGGGVTLLAGVGFASAAAQQQRNAQEINDKRTTQNITSSELNDYNNARDTRDSMRNYAVLSFSAGLAMATAGFFLYSFDQPKLKAIPKTNEQQPGKDKEPGNNSMEISATPVFTPNFAGASLVGIF
jgi:tetratricopeptide (TPR) repeat protein